jgi:hypothetical protein
MKTILFMILFVLLLSFLQVLYMRENLTLQEVADKGDAVLKRVGTLEKEHKKLQETVDTQDKRMGAASAQAAQVQSTFRSSLRSAEIDPMHRKQQTNSNQSKVAMPPARSQ